MTPPSRQHPPLFHRVFLGHLLMVLVCFVTTMVLLEYLFVGGLSLYLQRTPLILLPVMLALIGLAGLSALWTSGSAAIPLDRVSSLLEKDASAEEILDELAQACTEENAALIEALHGRLVRCAQQGHSRPLYVQLDDHLNILATDIDTAARFGVIPAEMTGKNLRAFLHPVGSDAKEITRVIAHGGDPVALDLHFNGVGGCILRASAVIHPAGEGRWLLLGNDVRRS